MTSTSQAEKCLDEFDEIMREDDMLTRSDWFDAHSAVIRQALSDADRVQGLIAALEDVHNAFSKGKFDKFGRFRPTKAEGEMLWFTVSRALQKFKEKMNL